jgi:acetyl-CoA acyltransferase
VRTPFARSGTAFKDLTAIDLGKAAVAELMQRTDLDGSLVDLVVYGTVLPSGRSRPTSRGEVSLLPHFPRTLQAYTVGRACASANQAITDAADQIALGHADIAIAAARNRSRRCPILHSRGMSDVLIAASKAKSMSQRCRSWRACVRATSCQPRRPSPSQARVSRWGQSADKMAKLNGISREAQDRFALRSHVNAAQGTPMGDSPPKSRPLLFRPRIRRCSPRTTAFAAIRATSSWLRSSPCSTGCMEPSPPAMLAAYRWCVGRVADVGRRGPGHWDTHRSRSFKSYAYAAVDPGEQLLQAPVLAAPVR